MDTDSSAQARVHELPRIGVWLGALARGRAVDEARAVRTLEELGYRMLWVGESDRGKEAFTHAAVLLAATRTAVIATGIANIWARDASATNAATYTLSDTYPRRFILGLGVSHPAQVNVRGHVYHAAYDTMVQYLDALDEAERRLPWGNGGTPRVLGALGPRMLRLARDRAHGAHPYLVTPMHTARARETMGPDALLAPEQAILLETDSYQARRAAREHLCLYLTLPNYTRNLRRLGFEERDMRSGGSDRLVDGLVAWGTADAVVARVQEHFVAGADHVAVQALSGRTTPLAQLAELQSRLPSDWLTA